MSGAYFDGGIVKINDATNLWARVLKSAVTNTNAGRMSARVVISTEDEDRSGDIVIAKGIGLSEHKKNPVGLFNHDKNAPVGRFEDRMGAYTVKTRNGRELVGELYFNQSSEFAHDVFRAVEEKIMTAVSIGFIPDRVEKRARRGTVYHSSKMVEASILPLGDNPHAIVEAVEKGFGGKQLCQPLRDMLKPFAAERPVVVTGGYATPVESGTVATMPYVQTVGSVGELARTKGVPVPNVVPFTQVKLPNGETWDIPNEWMSAGSAVEKTFGDDPKKKKPADDDDPFQPPSNADMEQEESADDADATMGDDGPMGGMGGDDEAGPTGDEFAYEEGNGNPLEDALKGPMGDAAKAVIEAWQSAGLDGDKAMEAAGVIVNSAETLIASGEDADFPDVGKGDEADDESDDEFGVGDDADEADNDESADADAFSEGGQTQGADDDGDGEMNDDDDPKRPFKKALAWREEDQREIVRVYKFITALRTAAELDKAKVDKYCDEFLSSLPSIEPVRKAIPRNAYTRKASWDQQADEVMKALREVQEEQSQMQLILRAITER